jgi:hypothetical protein
MNSIDADIAWDQAHGVRPIDEPTSTYQTQYMSPTHKAILTSNRVSNTNSASSATPKVPALSSTQGTGAVGNTHTILKDRKPASGSPQLHNKAATLSALEHLAHTEGLTLIPAGQVHAYQDKYGNVQGMMSESRRKEDAWEEGRQAVVHAQEKMTVGALVHSKKQEDEWVSKHLARDQVHDNVLQSGGQQGLSQAVVQNSDASSSSNEESTQRQQQGTSGVLQQAQGSAQKDASSSTSTPSIDTTHTLASSTQEPQGSVQAGNSAKSPENSAESPENSAKSPENSAKSPESVPAASGDVGDGNMGGALVAHVASNTFGAAGKAAATGRDSAQHDEEIRAALVRTGTDKFHVWEHLHNMRSEGRQDAYPSQHLGSVDESSLARGDNNGDDSGSSNSNISRNKVVDSGVPVAGMTKQESPIVKEAKFDAKEIGAEGIVALGFDSVKRFEKHLEHEGV